MERIDELSLTLLDTWCNALYRYQIKGTGDKNLDGAFLCPACAKIHGRSSDAMYPFMCMYSITRNKKWIDATIALFDWAEANVSCPDGSYINDIDSEWRGITVFTLITMLDVLIHHGNELPKDFRIRMEERSYKAAFYLATHDEYKKNNINYPISIALALYMAGCYHNSELFVSKYIEYKNIFYTVLTECNLIFGEGIPRDLLSERKCQPVDIGYNVEESIPSILRLARLSNDLRLLKVVEKVMDSHLSFLLPDGGWDNSFGTRVFKWTWWGSRTSDGATSALLMLGYKEEAERNLRLMKKCTFDGLLYGGPDLLSSLQAPCIHHTFTHAKVPALIIDDKLYSISGKVHEKSDGIKFFPEIDTYIVNLFGFRATITGYDWIYMKGGHASGGTLSLLYDKDTGPILVSGMCEYSIKERNNQQIPSIGTKHECLSLRIEAYINGITFSSLYDTKSIIDHDGYSFKVKGLLCDIDGNRSDLQYTLSYIFSDDAIDIDAEFNCGVMVLPIISNEGEKLRINERNIYFERGIVFESKEGEIWLPYGEKRIFNLVPGLQALKIELKKADKVKVRIRRHNFE